MLVFKEPEKPQNQGKMPWRRVETQQTQPTKYYKQYYMQYAVQSLMKSKSSSHSTNPLLKNDNTLQITEWKGTIIIITLQL